MEIFKLTFNDKIDKPTHPEIETDVSDCPCIFTATWLSLNLPRQPERFPQPSPCHFYKLKRLLKSNRDSLLLKCSQDISPSRIATVQFADLRPLHYIAIQYTIIKTLQNTLYRASYTPSQCCCSRTLAVTVIDTAGKK